MRRAGGVEGDVEQLTVRGAGHGLVPPRPLARRRGETGGAGVGVGDNGGVAAVRTAVKLHLT